jgi:hypothetical protein
VNPILDFSYHDANRDRSDKLEETGELIVNKSEYYIIVKKFEEKVSFFGKMFLEIIPKKEDNHMCYQVIIPQNTNVKCLTENEEEIKIEIFLHYKD